MRQADVSVVVVTHNRPSMLDELLRAEFSQTVQPREIIVVNNGSDSDTPGIVAKYGERVIYREVAGMPRDLSRNLGLSVASSTWISPIDDDDYHQPDFLASVLPAMADGRADMVGTDYQAFSSAGPLGRTRFTQMPPDYWDRVPKPSDDANWSFIDKFPMSHLVIRNPFEPGQMVVRKDLIMGIGAFDPKFPYPSEMFELNSRLLTAARLAIVWRPLLMYRRHSSNATKSEWSNRLFKLRAFEYIQAKAAHGSPELAKALDADLPKRRVAVFDQAFAYKQYDQMATLALALPEDAMNTWRRAMILAAHLPTPLAQLTSSLGRKTARLIGRSETLSYY